MRTLNRPAWPLVAALALASCSKEYVSEALKLRYEPANGFKPASEVAGPPAVARFSPGLDIYSVEAPPPALDESQLPAVLASAFTAAKLSAPEKVRSSRTGTLPVGPVARYELTSSEGHVLVYYVPRKTRFLLIRLTAPEERYGPLESRVEQSLASLQLAD